MNRIIINNIKRLIDNHQTDETKSYIIQTIQNINDFEYHINQLDIFKQAFNHACIRGNRDLISWFLEAYLTYFNDIEKIAIRQLFFYGKYLIINEKRHQIRDKEDLLHWYEEKIIPKIKIN